MATLSDLPPEIRAFLEQLALHESGHAVAAVALGFELRSVELSITEVFFGEITSWNPAGNTRTSANDVRRGTGEAQRRAATVAMAGRAARRLRFPEPEKDAAWRSGEGSDRNDALWVIGARDATPAEEWAVRTDPEAKRVWLKRREEELAPFTEAARQLLTEAPKPVALERLAAELIARGTVERVEEPGEKAALSFTSAMSGEEATRIILAAGVTSAPHNTCDP